VNERQIEMARWLVLVTFSVGVAFNALTAVFEWRGTLWTTLNGVVLLLFVAGVIWWTTLSLQRKRRRKEDHTDGVPPT